MNSFLSASKNHPSLCLLGAVAGDVIGSVYEFSRQKKYDFPLFSDSSSITDDSILTIAIADAILHKRTYKDSLQEYARKYPNPMGGYGMRFREWMYAEDPKPYNSFGNGSAMRVSAISYAFDTVKDVLFEAERTAIVSHNHPEGIKGAQAIALSIFFARKHQSKETIKQEITSRFNYDLDRTLDDIRPAYEFNETCQGTVPEAIIAFLRSVSYEDAVRRAISLGGDADTLGAITGSIAEAYYDGVPREIMLEVQKRVPVALWNVIVEFSQKYPVREE
jgi:ADP-ribosylglycohydrolase